MVIRTWPDVCNTYSHSLSLSEAREAPESVRSGRSRRSKSGKAFSVPNYEWPCHVLIVKLTRKHQAKGTVKGFQLELTLFWSESLWMGKTAYYETPQCSLSCSKLKGMLLSVRGRPLICEMLRALWKDQAYDLSQYVCVSALMPAPASSMFCQICFVQQQAYGISHDGPSTVPYSSHMCEKASARAHVYNTHRCTSWQ